MKKPPRKRVIQLVVLFSMTAVMMWSTQLSAQDIFEQKSGLFSRYDSDYSMGLMNRGKAVKATTVTNPYIYGNITGQTFGESDTPLGSGLLVLIAAGAGYALAQNKKNRQKK